MARPAPSKKDEGADPGFLKQYFAFCENSQVYLGETGMLPVV